MNDYFKQHGNLQGVDEKWGQYKDAYINQAKKDNPQYAGMITKPEAPRTKGQKTGDVIAKDSKKSTDDLSKGDEKHSNPISLAVSKSFLCHSHGV